MHPKETTAEAPRPSRRTFLAGATAVAATAALATAGSARADEPLVPADHERLNRLIARMSLEEKVGQLFVMRVYGHSATDPDPDDIASNQGQMGVSNAAELIAKYHVGGIIYFVWANNFVLEKAPGDPHQIDPYQIIDLSNGIQQAGLAQPTPLPLLITTDQEHGIVARVGAPATLMPGAMALGADGAVADTRMAAHISGAELAALGIRQNYSPVADVNVNPANPVINVRSFGADPQAVARLVAAEVQGYQSSGVAATAKHFPGHGDTGEDSHYRLPVITHSLEEWERLDAPPFKAAIAAGIDSIMTAHLLFPALDPTDDPATLSRPILTGVLREKLGFGGVVVTDSLGMAGVRQKYGDDRVPVLALKAGADQLLNPPDLPVAWNAVLNAVREGEITERRIDESILRILALKDRLGLFRDPYVTHDRVDQVVGTKVHLAAADLIAERTTTLLVNTGSLLPLSPRTHRNVLVVGVDPPAPSGTGGPPTTVLARALNELGFVATALSTGTASQPSPSQETIDKAVAAARGRDAVLVATYNVSATSSQRTLVSALADTGVPVVHLAIRNPYDIARLNGVGASLATYSWTDVELRAAARVIAGEAGPTGRLPVPVPRADDPAQVLYPIGYGLSY